MVNGIRLYVKNRFGSKRGLLSAARYQLLYWLGFYSRYKQVPLARVNRLVFVCSGNICRSPFAEACARDLGIKAISYGLHCRGNDPADPRAQALSEHLATSLDEHLTRAITTYISQPGDLLICMEPRQIPEAQAHLGKGVGITLLGLWHPRPHAYIHDPYSANEAFFDRCEHTILTATYELVKQIRDAHAQA